MTRFFMKHTIGALFAITLSSGVLLAQAAEVSEQSPDEIINMFEMQTRGLILAPSNNSAESSDTTANGASVETPEIADVPREQQVFVNISFDFDSAVLNDDQKPKLTNLCIAINSSDIAQFKIVGHTDSSGSDAYNESLSLLRAEEVKRYMINDCGIAEDRLLAVGVGERYPYNEQDPRSEENRRVEFQVVG